jgi:hypothetical protein
MKTRPANTRKQTAFRLLLSTFTTCCVAQLREAPRRNRVKAGQRLAKEACLIAFSFLSVFSDFAQGAAIKYPGRLNSGTGMMRNFNV